MVGRNQGAPSLPLSPQSLNQIGVISTFTPSSRLVAATFVVVCSKLTDEWSSHIPGETTIPGLLY